jgi:hypothetical protein
MKAEQRKQLEKNELASHLDRLWKGAGDAKSSSTIWVVVGAVVLTGVLVFAWRYYASESQKNRATLWRQIEQATTEKELEQIIEGNRGTEVARVAKAQLARISMSDGLDKLCSEFQRKDAIISIQKARDLLDQIIKDSGDDKQLLREAMLSRAKAEEALVGIPKVDNSSETCGSLETALALYQETADKFADTPHGKEAAERAKEIRENKQKIQQFYDDLNKRFVKFDFPKAPETPAPELPPIPSTKTGDLPPPLTIPEPPAKTNPMTPLPPPPKTEEPKPKSDPPKTETPKADPAKPKAEPPKSDKPK